MRIVFCGGCNPVIDRVALADELRADPALAALDVEIDISGCSRSCAAGQQLAGATPDVLVVAGRHLDGRLLEPSELAAAIKRRLSTGKET
ncbi:MAG TPA: hypothetical protein VL117_13880 [Thermoleophilia bacterium]|nr:hypothetical protein [Thermoleophilia bacterium]